MLWKMHIKNTLRCYRWSTIVPILFYTCFFCLIWTLAVPLKSNHNSKYNLKDKIESFKLKVKNVKSNFEPTLTQNEAKLDSVNNDQFKDLSVDIQLDSDLKKDPTEILKEVFQKADTDNNKKLDIKELSKWINFKIKQHIAKAVQNNYGLFTMIDVNPRNGVVTWEEYHAFFLKQKGFDSKYVKNHDEKRHKGLKRTLKEQIMRDKAYWQEAAKFDPDSLTLDEFLAFTHPESSAANQLALVDELYEKFDRDGDEILTEDEFATLQMDALDETSAVLLRQSEQERREEFRNAVDVNGDGRADRRELLRYVAPQNPRRSELEARALISLADSNRDGVITLPEVLAHPDLFMASKMVDTARSFHDEF